jgi:hypothetical protein
MLHHRSYFACSAAFGAGGSDVWNFLSSGGPPPNWRLSFPQWMLPATYLAYRRANTMADAARDIFSAKKNVLFDFDWKFYFSLSFGAGAHSDSHAQNGAGTHSDSDSHAQNHKEGGDDQKRDLNKAANDAQRERD